MTWLRADNVSGFDEVLGLRPAACASFDEMFGGLWNAGVEGTTLDACQARVDALLRCEPDPTNDLDLTEASRAAVSYAEQYALDPHALRDADFERLHEFFSDAQLATLTLAVAMFDAQSPLLGRIGGVMARVRNPKGGMTPFDHHPELWAAFNRYYGTLWSDGVVDDPTKEVGRLRNARVTGCGICKNLRFANAREQGLDEPSVDLITDEYAGSELPERWKLAIRLADALIGGAHVDAELRAALLAEFTDEQIVELTATIATAIAFSKASVAFGAPEEMPLIVVPTPTVDGDVVR